MLCPAVFIAMHVQFFQEVIHPQSMSFVFHVFAISPRTKCFRTRWLPIHKVTENIICIELSLTYTKFFNIYENLRRLFNFNISRLICLAIIECIRMTIHRTKILLRWIEMVNRIVIAILVLIGISRSRRSRPGVIWSVANGGICVGWILHILFLKDIIN